MKLSKSRQFELEILAVNLGFELGRIMSGLGNRCVVKKGHILLWMLIKYLYMPLVMIQENGQYRN